MPQSLADIRTLLETHGLSPRHALGQNFLIDQNLVRKLVDVSGVTQGSLVLEVGPGTGTLTEELLARGARVIACELDVGLGQLIASRLASAIEKGQLTLVRGDCLDGKRVLSPAIVETLASAGSPPKEFVLVANLPYGAATPLMLTLLLHHPLCRSMHVTIQREVGDKLMSRPGSPHWSPLGAIAHTATGPAQGGTPNIKRIAVLPPECFWPRPDITSVMVSLKRRGDLSDADLGGELERLDQLCRVIFGQRRKQLGSILGRGFTFPPSIEPTRRAEELGLDELALLARAYQECVKSGNEHGPASVP